MLRELSRAPWVLLAGLLSGGAPLGAEEPRPTDASKAAARIDGRELFTREWIPGDKRSHGGDGLGPLFNESSCVACHNQGGVGGGGDASKNAQLLTAFPNPPAVHQRNIPARPRSLPEAIFRGLFGSLDEAVEEIAVESVPVAADADPLPQPNTPAGRSGAALSPEKLAEIEKQRKDLGKLHPGLAMAPSIVLHRSATYAEYEPWRQQFALNQGVTRSVVEQRDAPLTHFAVETVPVSEPRAVAVPASISGVENANAIQRIQTHRSEAQMAAQRRMFNQASQHGNFAIVQSERNTSALFGAGVVDAVSDEALRAIEAEQAKAGRVSGRISRLKDGKIGRFGWKGQIAHLDDFVLTACAVELGLQVPEHAQAGLPHQPDYKPAGLDLNAEECRALTKFVSDLPAPKQRPIADATDRAFVNAGLQLFERIGCAECHRADVGDAKGIYSDLLLHDMGPDLGDSGSSYGIFVPDSTPDGQSAPQGDLVDAKGQRPAPKLTAATRQEWRTPPLWGARDSAPYLHDGRAETLEQAIAFHGGESARSAQQFFSLAAEERFQVVTFLKSLVAPETRLSSR